MAFSGGSKAELFVAAPPGFPGVEGHLLVIHIAGDGIVPKPEQVCLAPVKKGQVNRQIAGGVGGQVLQGAGVFRQLGDVQRLGKESLGQQGFLLGVNVHF